MTVSISRSRLGGVPDEETTRYRWDVERVPENGNLRTVSILSQLECCTLQRNDQRNPLKLKGICRYTGD